MPETLTIGTLHFFCAGLPWTSWDQFDLSLAEPVGTCLIELACTRFLSQNLYTLRIGFCRSFFLIRWIHFLTCGLVIGRYLENQADLEVLLAPSAARVDVQTPTPTARPSTFHPLWGELVCSSFSQLPIQLLS
jgi:hypothetical protein